MCAGVLLATSNRAHYGEIAVATGFFTTAIVSGFIFVAALRYDDSANPTAARGEIMVSSLITSVMCGLIGLVKHKLEHRFFLSMCAFGLAAAFTEFVIQIVICDKTSFEFLPGMGEALLAILAYLGHVVDMELKVADARVEARAMWQRWGEIWRPIHAKYVDQLGELTVLVKQAPKPRGRLRQCQRQRGSTSFNG